MTASFAVRGVIEGFYGNPYTHAQRLDLVDFLAAHEFNTFVYGPKDDPYVRARWRDRYEGDDRARLAAVSTRCREAGIAFVACVSPGLTIHYSEAADVAALCARLDDLLALGAEGVALLLEDIPGGLQTAEDRAAFGDLATAHVALVNAVKAHLGPGSWLIVCPWTYWGRGTEPYLETLGQGIDPSIDLFWTGRAICSPTLDLDDARVFDRTTRRPPLYWDNYPVNDVAMGWELHVGPYRGRDPQLVHGSRGIIANPMELYEASKIPLATIGEYLADPAGYDPDEAWLRAIREVAGEADLEAFALFAENTLSSCLNNHDAPTVTGALEAFLFRYGNGEGEAAARDLASLAGWLSDAAAHLLRGQVANPALIAECRPWIEAFEVGAAAMAAMARLGAAGRLEEDARAELRPYLVELRRRRVRIFGDALDMTLSDLTATHVRPGELTLAEPGGGELA